MLCPTCENKPKAVNTIFVKDKLKKKTTNNYIMRNLKNSPATLEHSISIKQQCIQKEWCDNAGEVF